MEVLSPRIALVNIHINAAIVVDEGFVFIFKSALKFKVFIQKKLFAIINHLL